MKIKLLCVLGGVGIVLAIALFGQALRWSMEIPRYALEGWTTHDEGLFQEVRRGYPAKAAPSSP